MSSGSARRTRGTVDPRIAWGIAAASIASMPATFLLRDAASPDAVATGEDPLTALLLLVLVISLLASPAIVGAFLASRVPDNRVGPLLLVAGVLGAVAIAVTTYAEAGLEATQPWPGAALADALSGEVWSYPIIVTLIGVPLIFPGGNPLTRRESAVGVATILATVATSMDRILQADAAGRAGSVASVGTLVLFACFALAATSLWRRFRGSDPVVRQQTKWLLATVIPAIVALGIGAVLSLPEPFATAAFVVGLLAIIAVPIAIGIAITRYHLYEIDRIVSRTLSYLIVSAVLAAAFVVATLALGALFGELAPSETVADARGETITVAVSTLIAASLFGTVRRRAQAVVDRRFDRAQYDAAQTVIDLTDHLRDDVDLEHLAGDVLRVVDVSLHPTTRTLWIRPNVPVASDAGRPVTISGRSLPTVTTT